MVVMPSCARVVTAAVISGEGMSGLERESQVWMEGVEGPEVDALGAAIWEDDSPSNLDEVVRGDSDSPVPIADEDPATLEAFAEARSRSCMRLAYPRIGANSFCDGCDGRPSEITEARSDLGCTELGRTLRLEPMNSTEGSRSCSRGFGFSSSSGFTDREGAG